MSLSQSINAAISGLQATQSALTVVAGNVANASTPNYIRKSSSQVATGAGASDIGVRVIGINRELDAFVQAQLQTETSGGAFADLRASFYDQLQQIYGQPGSNGALETVFNNFTTAVQGLSTAPDSSAARSGVIASAQALTQQLNAMTASIQGLRTNAEAGLASAVQTANQAMQQIATINQKLAGSNVSDATTTVLEDQRDSAINQLAQLMDIRVVPTGQNQLSVFTNSGVQLVGAQASQFSYDNHGTLSAQNAYSTDPNQRGVGTITLVTPNGGSTDLLATNSIRSGQIAAYVQMRDQVLPQAQAQLDQIAAAMSSALSDQTVGGTAVTAGAQTGFDLDTSSLLAGNQIQLTYTDNTTNTQRQVTIIRVDDPAALPLSNSATPNGNDKVVGVNFSGGMASVVAQLNSALGGTFLQFSNPAGTTLRVLNDGAGNKITVNAASTTSTVTTLTGGSAQLPFFADAAGYYTGAITSAGPQSVGLAGRIAVNSALAADPSRLVVYQTSPLTAAGDATRPNFISNQLTRAALAFAPQAGIGSPANPYNGTLGSYLQQVIGQQAQAASAADNLKQGQDVVVNSLQQRLNNESGVNVDTEMATLLQLQNAYGANARVMTTVRDLIQLLLQM